MSTLDILRQLNCTEWVKGDNRRFYFNDLLSWYGDLETIDRMKATEIKRIIKRMKVYYEVKTGKISYHDSFRNDEDSRMAGFIFETIKKNIITKFKEVKKSQDEQTISRK
jgi:hypothetical protein